MPRPKKGTEIAGKQANRAMKKAHAQQKKGQQKEQEEEQKEEPQVYQLSDDVPEEPPVPDSGPEEDYDDLEEEQDGVIIEEEEEEPTPPPKPPKKSSVKQPKSKGKDPLSSSIPDFSLYEPHVVQIVEKHLRGLQDERLKKEYAKHQATLAMMGPKLEM